MPEPPFQNDMRSQGVPPRPVIHSTMHARETPDSLVVLLTVTRPEEIPAALAQGKPVLIDIAAVQWRLSWLAAIAKWGGMWLVGFLMHWWLAIGSMHNCPLKIISSLIGLNSISNDGNLTTR